MQASFILHSSFIILHFPLQSLGPLGLFLNRALTDSLWWMRWIASPSSSATLRPARRSWIASQRVPMGIVSVTASFVYGHALSRSIAGGAKTAWVAAR